MRLPTSSRAPTRFWSISARSIGSGREAIEIAIRGRRRRRPWVLDPVFVDRSPQRATFARSLVARAGRRPFASTARNSPRWRTPRRADATLGRYALEQRCVVALTGATDVVTDGSGHRRIVNGDPLMGRVTAMGCAGTAVVAAALAVESRCADRDRGGPSGFRRCGRVSQPRAPAGPAASRSKSSTRLLGSTARRCAPGRVRMA